MCKVLQIIHNDNLNNRVNNTVKNKTTITPTNYSMMHYTVITLTLPERMQPGTDPPESQFPV